MSLFPEPCRTTPNWFLFPFSGRWKRRLSEALSLIMEDSRTIFQVIQAYRGDSPRVPEKFVPAPNHSQHNLVLEADASANGFLQQ